MSLVFWELRIAGRDVLGYMALHLHVPERIFPDCSLVDRFSRNLCVCLLLSLSLTFDFALLPWASECSQNATGSKVKLCQSGTTATKWLDFRACSLS